MNQVFQLGEDTLVNFGNVGLVMLETQAQNAEVIITDENSPMAPAAKVVFFAQGGKYEIHYSSAEEARSVFKELASGTSAKVIEAKTEG